MPRRTPPRPELLGLLQAVVQEPGDDTPLLVLTDWLEEHDDPRRAELLRLHLFEGVTLERLGTMFGVNASTVSGFAGPRSWDKI